MESKQEPSLIARNENPPLLSRRVRTQPLMVTCDCSPGFPARASATDTSGMTLSLLRACGRQRGQHGRHASRGPELPAAGPETLLQCARRDNRARAEVEERVGLVQHAHAGDFY